MNRVLSKRFLIVALLVLSLALLITATQVWVTIDLVEGAATVSQVTVTGQDIATGVLPIALALLAIAVTLAIAGRVMRIVLAVLAAALGGWISYASFDTLLGAPQRLVALAAPELAQVTGLSAGEHFASVSEVTRSAWPLVSAIAGTLVALFGIFVLIFGRGWKTAGRKYESSAPATPRAQAAGSDRISDWDALSDGDDPSLTDDNAGQSGDPSER